MAYSEDLLERLVKGAIIVAVGAVALVGIIFLLLMLAPFAVSVALLDFFYFRHERAKIERKKQQEIARQYYEDLRIAEERKEIEKKERIIADKRLREWQKIPFGYTRKEYEEKNKKQKPTFEQTNEDYYKESELTKKQRDTVLAWNYKRLKISPDGKSGAAFYWVRKRYNESKEHAFFCYLIKDELKKRRIRDVTLNVTEGPDIEFELKKKRYCFEVETGSNLVRDSTYVFKKFAFNQQNFHKCFVFVTNKKFKYRYSKMADIVTRATLKKTIAGLGI